MKAKSLETALEKVTRIITNRYGLRLVCEGDECRTNGRIIYLPSLPEDIPEELLGAIRGWADHEAAHVRYTRTQVGPGFEREHGKKAFGILNALEDGRVEAKMSRRYPGARLNMREAFRFVSDRFERQRPLCSPFRQFTSALYTRAANRPDQSWIPGQAYELVQECEPELSGLPACRSTDQVAEVAKAVWEKVKDRFEDVEESPDSEAPETPPEDQQDASAAGKGQPPDQQQQAAEPQDESPSGAEGGGPLGGSDGLGLMDDLAGMIQTELRSRPGEPGTYRVYTTKYDVVEVPRPDPGFDYRKEAQAIQPYVAGLRRRLIRTLMGRRETRWLGDKTRGRLDPRSLHRLTTGRSGRIFRERTVTDGGMTACTLLLDLSSSMNGTQIQLCRQMALVFAETLDKLSFPTEIIGFSTEDRDLRYEVAQESGVDPDELAKRFARMVPLYHAIFKAFDEPWRKAAGRLGAVKTRSLTPLGESLLFAGKRLAHRPEKRKVLFCLTDGKPVVGAWDENVTLEHACRAVKRLTSAGIEPVGIGILEQSVETIFPRHAVIHKLEDLPKSFLRQLCLVLTERR